MIYFLTADAPGYPIKIGYTEDADRLAGRVATLQTALAWDVVVFAVGENLGRGSEKYLHDLLANHRMRGEWFKRSDAVLAITGYMAKHPRTDHVSLQENAARIYAENSDLPPGRIKPRYDRKTGALTSKSRREKEKAEAMAQAARMRATAGQPKRRPLGRETAAAKRARLSAEARQRIKDREERKAAV